MLNLVLQIGDRDGLTRLNPDWNSAGYDGNMPPVFEWSKEHFKLRTFQSMESPVPFNRESWRGRIRACRGIGASLTEGEIQRFDGKLEQLLKQVAKDDFTVLHQMTIHIFEQI